MGLNVLGVVQVGGSSSSASSSSTNASPAGSASSDTVARDTVTLSQQGKEALQGKTAPDQTATVANDTYTAQSASQLTSTSAQAQRAQERAINKQAVTDEAVSTIGSLSRMTRAYAMRGSSQEDATVRNSFNRLFASNADLSSKVGDKSRTVVATPESADSSEAV